MSNTISFISAILQVLLALLGLFSTPTPSFPGRRLYGPYSTGFPIESEFIVLSAVLKIPRCFRESHLNFQKVQPSSSQMKEEN